MSMTVARPVSALRSGDHACLTFASDVQQREAVTRFVARGLAGREKVALIARLRRLIDTAVGEGYAAR